MDFRSRRRIPPVITVIPMIDILMILLIFFIVTTTFKSAVPQVQIVLPAMKTGVQKTATSKPAILAIAENGDVYLEDKTVSVQTIGDAVKKIQGEGRPLALKADEKAPVGRMFEVLDALQASGLKELPAFTREKKR